jgi:hypothetical protein
MTRLYKFYLRLLYPKAIAEKAVERFFSLLASLLIYEIRISGGSAKRQRYLFLVGPYLLHGICFFEFFFALRGVSGQSLFRKLFILFTGILLKSRVCLKDTRPKPKAGL